MFYGHQSRADSSLGETRARCFTTGGWGWRADVVLEMGLYHVGTRRLLGMVAGIH